MAYPARTLLACWLLMVATGTVVTHRHASAPGDGRTLGWASVAAPSPPAGTPLTHGHFVFFGIELGETAGECGSEGPGDSARVDRAATDVSPAEAACPLVDLIPLAPARVDSLPNDRTAVPSDPATTRTCPLASRARSGVLRV